MPSRAAPSPSSNRSGAHLHPLLRPVILTMLVCALVLSGAGAIARGPVTLVLTLAAATGTAIALRLLAAERHRAAILTALAVPLACAAAAMWVGDGLRDVAVMVLPVVILLGCLVLERPYSTLYIAVAVMVPVVIGGAERVGWLPNPDLPTTEPVDYFVAPVLLAGLGFVADLIATALMRSEASYRAIFNATHEAIFVHDAETGAIVDVNERMLAMYGYERRDLARLSLAALSGHVAGDAAARADALVQRAVTEGPQLFEWLARRQDGSEFWVEVTLRRSEIGGVSRVLAVVRDIDERKRSAAQALQSEKLRSLGLLAGGVAHDFNNQLAVIGGLAQLIGLRARDAVVVAEHAGQIVEATRRAAELTGRLLAFARKGSARDEPVDVNALTADTAELLRRSLVRGIDVRVVPAAERLIVIGDPAQLANALLNLGINARDAMPTGGSLTFQTSAVSLDASDAAAMDVEPGRYAAIAVRDTGEGMSAEVLAHAFEPFYTTKPEGTGMGLAQVYGAARAHRGGVRADSQPGTGSELLLYVPLAGLMASPPPSGPAAKETRLALRVLVAEDEERLAFTTRQLLEQLGCTVKVCHDGVTVVELYARAEPRFDVVLLDLAMPRRTGAEALAELRRIDPEARVVLTSGYATSADVERLLAAGAAGFIGKPTTLEALVNALRRAVAEGTQDGTHRDR